MKPLTAPVERQVLQLVREALGRAPDCVLWRNSVGNAEYWDTKLNSPRVLQYGLAVGSADLVGIGPGGRFFALEVKRPGGRVRPEQTQWIELVRRRGGFAAVVTSADEALAALERARRGLLA